MPDKALGDDLRHDLVGVVDALATLESEREGERVGEVGRVSESQLVGLRSGSIAAPSERNKNRLARRGAISRTRPALKSPALFDHRPAVLRWVDAERRCLIV